MRQVKYYDMFFYTSGKLFQNSKLLPSSTDLCQLVQLIVSLPEEKKMLEDNRVRKNMALAKKLASQ